MNVDMILIVHYVGKKIEKSSCCGFHQIRVCTLYRGGVGEVRGMQETLPLPSDSLSFNRAEPKECSTTWILPHCSCDESFHPTNDTLKFDCPHCVEGNAEESGETTAMFVSVSDDDNFFAVGRSTPFKDRPVAFMVDISPIKPTCDSDGSIDLNLSFPVVGSKRSADQSDPPITKRKKFNR